MGGRSGDRGEGIGWGLRGGIGGRNRVRDSRRGGRDSWGGGGGGGLGGKGSIGWPLGERGRDLGDGVGGGEEIITELKGRGAG